MAINKVTLPIRGSDLKTKLNEIIDEFSATMVEYGSDGRLRFDEAKKHFYFEVLDGGNWVTKLEIGKSIIVDALRLVKADKPSNIALDELAIYNREIILPEGLPTVRPTIVTPNGQEYGLVVDNQQTGEIQFRKNDGTLVNIPIIYVDSKDDEYTDLSKIKILGATITKDATSKELLIDIPEIEVIEVDGDLTIDRSNYLDYRYKTLSCVKDGVELQNILLPEIKSIPGAADFTITNARPNDRTMLIRAYPGDQIGSRTALTLLIYDSVTLERPIKGTRWIVKSNNQGNIDGGEI